MNLIKIRGTPVKKITVSFSDLSPIEGVMGRGGESSFAKATEDEEGEYSPLRPYALTPLCPPKL